MKRRYPGRAMHIEYHTVNQKRSKAADCIYLTDDRVCQNKKSYQYLSKCFMASNCPWRMREKDAEEAAREAARVAAKEKKVSPNPKQPTNEKQPKAPKVPYVISPNCPMYNSYHGNGRCIEYNAKSRIMTVQFKKQVAYFPYPKAILDKHLLVPKPVFEKVWACVSQTKKE